MKIIHLSLKEIVLKLNHLRILKANSRVDIMTNNKKILRGIRLNKFILLRYLTLERGKTFESSSVNY